MNEETQDTDMTAYDTLASAYCKAACAVWCLVGWVYAALSWRLLWIPAVLVFFPGIFLAGLLAAIFFIPLWFTMNKVNRDWDTNHTKDWGLLVLATLLRIGGLVVPIAGAVVYVKLIRSIIE